jgi:membrane protease YdiL (CAAX protease family)
VTVHAPGLRMFATGAPWGWRHVLVGVGVGIGLFIFTSLVVLVLITLLDYDSLTADVGDTFEIAGRIAEYSDERLQAVATGADLPEPPFLKADIRTMRLAFLVTLLYQVAVIVSVPLITRRSPSQLAADLKIEQMDWATFWIPFLAMIGTYIGVGIYAAVIEAIGPDILVPESTVPTAITRDGLALAIAGIAAVGFAPVAEELFYRGLIFGGLLRFGFWPAGAASAFLFSATHLDPGSLLPFFGIGMVLAWLAWRRGCIWDAIMFHLFFNATSFLLLIILES